MFVVPEGSSDAAALSVWARRAGIDLERAGVQIIAAEGATRISSLAQLISVAYQGARVVVLFDGDEEGQRAAQAAQEALGDRVEIHVLRRGAIESYLSGRAFETWARIEALKAGRSELAVPGGSVSDALMRRTCNEIWGKQRRYSKTEHVRRVAELMDEGEIAPEIIEILQGLIEPREP